MINHNNQAVLIDFGLSALFDQEENDEMGSNMGSLTYFAPEMFSSSKVKIRGEKTDLWALGITLFYMLTG